jgi:hypothetical protein
MVKFIEPGHDFPNEKKLPDTWREPLREIQEHELALRWKARFPNEPYKDALKRLPDHAPQWAGIDIIRAERDATVSDWILTNDMARLIEKTNPPRFRDPNLQSTYRTFRDIGLNYRNDPNKLAADPQGLALVAEARRAAVSEPKWALDALRHRLDRVDKAVKPEFLDIGAKLNNLGDALEAWSNALKGEAIPDESTLTKLADQCLQHFQAAQVGAAGFTPKANVSPSDSAFVKVVVRQFVETMAGVMGDQLAARLGEPSFLNMFNRLREHPRGTEVADSVQKALADSSGNYRSVWTKESDKIIRNFVVDAKQRDALRKALESSKLDFGPNLDKWKREFDKIGNNKNDMKTMREAVLRLTFAAESYLSIVSKNVGPIAETHFIQLIDGIIISIAKDVKVCTESEGQ